MPYDAHSSGLLTVREETPRYGASYSYEDEGSERSTTGSVPVAPDARWTARLTVPIPARDIIFLRIERQGPLPVGYLGGEESITLSLPPSEMDAVMSVLSGITAQARRDDVLP